MKTVMAAKRDARIDMVRALALLTIFINHVPGNVLERFTYRNFGFSDATEVFMLVSGISIGLAYGTRFASGQRAGVALRMWRRAGVLYVSHIVVTIAGIALFCIGALYSGRPELLSQINIAPVMERTPEAMIGIATLGHQIGYNNILPVYALLLLAAPLMILGALRWPGTTLGCCGLLWLAAGLWQIAPRNYPEAGQWFLNPLSWQFLFAIGIAGAIHVRRSGAVPVNRWGVALAGAYAIGALAWVHSPLWGQVTWLGLPPVVGGFDKTYLSLSRLLHILAVAYLVLALCSVSAVRFCSDNPLAVLGRRSLAVFIAGTVLALAAQMLRMVHAGGVGYDLCLLALGIAAQFGLAYYLDWVDRVKSAGRSDAAVRQRAPAPSGARVLAGHGA
jgi:hypothetical protein